MSTCLRSLDGPAVLLSADRRARPLTAAQARARRNLLWLRATETGMTDGVTGRPRIRGARELAELWGVSKQAVLDGLKSARALQGEIRELAAHDW